jgi:four helix bundle protein
MLRIYDDMLGVLRLLREPLVRIERHDGDLGRQLRRAATSVTLNLGEGSGSSGGIRKARYRTALGSAREVKACLESAEALGYITRIDSQTSASLLKVINVLVNQTV